MINVPPRIRTSGKGCPLDIFHCPGASQYFDPLVQVGMSVTYQAWSRSEEHIIKKAAKETIRVSTGSELEEQFLHSITYNL